MTQKLTMLNKKWPSCRLAVLPHSFRLRHPARKSKSSTGFKSTKPGEDFIGVQDTKRHMFYRMLFRTLLPHKKESDGKKHMEIVQIYQDELAECWLTMAARCQFLQENTTSWESQTHSNMAEELKFPQQNLICQDWLCHTNSMEFTTEDHPDFERKFSGKTALQQFTHHPQCIIHLWSLPKFGQMHTLLLLNCDIIHELWIQITCLSFIISSLSYLQSTRNSTNMFAEQRKMNMNI